MNVSTNASVSVNGGNINATASVNANNVTPPTSLSVNPFIDPEIAKFAYEKAIEAYQFHVNRYKDWMNLYAIFTGAMFVGLYTILNLNSQPQPQPKSEIGCIPYIITLIGLIASICWWMSQTGYYNWLLSWTKILHQREKDYMGNQTYVYSKIAKMNMCVSQSGRAPKFISTQKVTSAFIQVIVLGWMLILTHLIYRSNNLCLSDECTLIITSLVLLICFFGLRYLINCSTGVYSSSIGHMFP